MSDQNQSPPESTPDSSRTGFKKFINFVCKGLPTSEWVKLLAAPILLSLVGTGITNSFQEQSRKNEHYLQEQGRQNETVNKYFEQMEQLIVDKKIDFAKSTDSVKSLIKGKSLATLRSVDNSRKEIVLSFLSESDLLNSRKQGISLSYFNLEQVNLSGFNLTGINLKNAVLVKANLEGSLLKQADLSNADLSNANLSGANLSGADLLSADLSRAYLGGADLRRAKLIGADLSDAILIGADLRGADLSDAILIGANLRGADLRGAILSAFGLSGTGTKLSGATILSGANLSLAQNLDDSIITSACDWERAVYTESTWDDKNQMWIAIDKKANQKVIDKIKQDQALSIQGTTSDCSRFTL